MVIILCFLGAVISSCSAADLLPSPGEPVVSDNESLPRTAIAPNRLIPNETNMPERIPDDSTSNITGEVPPELLDSVIADLSDLLDRNKDAIQVVRAEQVIWNDGSLGCPEPGAFYTQATVPGYRIVLEIDGEQFNYHANESGFFFICPAGQRPGAPPSRGTPDS